MAFSTFTTTWVPTWGASVAPKPKLFVTTYGDGYKQVSQNGINFKPESWSLKWEVSESVANAIEAFINGQIGTPFKWTSPKGVQIVVSCDEGCTHTWDSYGLHTITATFLQDFSPEI